MRPRSACVGGRAQLEVGERGLEIEAGAAHHDRAPARGQRRIDLGVSAGRELARREGLGRLDERQQPVLEPTLLRGARRAGQDLKAAIDLQGVGRHRQRVLAAGPEQLRERDGNRRLADAGGAEKGDHVHDR